MLRPDFGADGSKFYGMENPYSMQSPPIGGGKAAVLSENIKGGPYGNPYRIDAGRQEGLYSRNSQVSIPNRGLGSPGYDAGMPMGRGTRADDELDANMANFFGVTGYGKVKTEGKVGGGGAGGLYGKKEE